MMGLPLNSTTSESLLHISADANEALRSIAHRVEASPEPQHQTLDFTQNLGNDTIHQSQSVFSHVKNLL